MGLTDYERLAFPPHRPARYELRRVFWLMERLGNPHTGIPTVHIAGTKGKGSTAAMCASVLTAQGYRIGLYTSPHLHTFCERICLDQHPVSQEEFASLTEAVWPAMEAVNREGTYSRVTVFELLTAMAFSCFRKHSAQAQVVEVGMGGRLDSTNIVTPSVCIITSISLDHTAVLGKTLERIAGEKAGIIKPGSTVVSAPQRPEALAVIQSVCQDKGARLILVGCDILWRKGASTLEGQECHVRGRLDSYSLRMPLLGEYQLENAAVAIGALEVLKEQTLDLSSQAIIDGFRTVQWPCRMEVLHRQPLIVADGAHNPYSMNLLIQSLSGYFNYRRVILVMGASSDKNLGQMVAEISQLQPRVIVTRSRHPRAATATVLADIFSAQGLQATQVEDAGQAVEKALEWAGKDDLVLVTGSLFAAAEAREVLKGIPPEIYPELQKDAAATTI